jgi:hypothetical protein
MRYKMPFRSQRSRVLCALSFPSILVTAVYAGVTLSLPPLPADAVFARLRLWRDADHDGLSQAVELYALPALGVVRLHLNYKESKRTDAYGNRFAYRAKVDDTRGTRVNRWAWDVFLVTQ